MSHDDKEQLEPPRWTPNFGPFDESALLMEIIAMWGVHGAHAQVCRMLIERAALSASVEQPMVYWSERDDNGEWQHYRATPEHAGKVMTERFAGRTAPIGPDNCLLSTERERLSEKPQDAPKKAKPAAQRPKPTIAELEWILGAPDGVFVTNIEPNGELRSGLGPKFFEMFPDAAPNAEKSIAEQVESLTRYWTSHTDGSGLAPAPEGKGTWLKRDEVLALFSHEKDNGRGGGGCSN